MKKHILSLGILCFQIATTKAIGQENSSMAAWLSAHPSVHIFSEKNYDHLSLEFKSKLKGKVIVYKDKLTLDLLTAYETMGKTDEVSSTASARDKSEKQAVKEWLVLNPQVKIIKHSEFLLMTEERRLMYESNEALFLLGEAITYQDIINYPH